MPMRNQELTREALDAAATNIPFVMLGIDTDNDSAFINQTIIDYCKERNVVQTRSRPYRKNDQAWVEQKNGAVVRRLAGYERFSGTGATHALANLYVASRLYINYFQPFFKLKSKQREGARVAKLYCPPSTPCDRLMASTSLDNATKARLKHECDTLDPMTLLRDIRVAQQGLQELGVRVTAKPDSSLTPVDVQSFLSSLATAWKSGEARPTPTKECSTENVADTRRPAS